jgi:arginyl-tRNA synthetase
VEAKKKISFYNDPEINLVTPEKWDAAKELQEALKQELVTASGSTCELERPKDNNFGDYSANVAMILAKQQGRAPKEVAAEIVTKLKQSAKFNELISDVSVAGPGFINLTVNKPILFKELTGIVAAKEDFGKTNILRGKRIMFEYAHPNPFKAFHIGHLRNIILGESLIRLLEEQGAEVIRTNYQGDVGMHIAKCLWAFRKTDPKDYPADITARVQLLAKAYAAGAKVFENETEQSEIKEINRKIYSREDEEINKLWELGKQWSLDKFHQLYTRVNSTFVREYMESEVLELCHEYITEALEKGILEKSQGAVVFKGAQYGLDTRVFLNSQGLPTYEGKELGLAHLEFSDYGRIDLCIHNVAVEQISFFKVTFKVEALLDPEKYAGRQYHNAYEFVGLKSGKMSSRTGNVVLGEDILNEAVTMITKILQTREGFSDEQIKNTAEAIGVGAIKYSFLDISPKSYLAFDLDKSISFEGDSGPYLQYTFARANKIISDAGDWQSVNDADLSKLELNSEELQVLRTLLFYRESVVEAAKHLAPNLLCSYLFTLASAFNLFYKKHTILKESDAARRNFRIMLSVAVSSAMKYGLDLLGIKTVTEM